MTSIPTVISDLARLSIDLEDAYKNVAEADYNWVRAKSVYEQAYDSAYLESSGTIATRERIASIETSDDRLNMELLAQELRRSKYELDVIKSRISVAQSLGALLRSEMSLGGLAT